jgi:hypothetical protein
MALREQSIPLQVSRSRGSSTVSITQPPPSRSQLPLLCLPPTTFHSLSPKAPRSADCLIADHPVICLLSSPGRGASFRSLTSLLTACFLRPHSSRPSLKSIVSRTKVQSSIYRGGQALKHRACGSIFPTLFVLSRPTLLSACLFTSPSIVIRSDLPLL